MGCICSRQQEPEMQIKFGSSRNEVHNIEEQIRESLTNVISKFNDNIQYLGEYISSSDFDSIIPKEISEYMIQHPFEKYPDNEQKTSSFEIQPIQFRNGNIYAGNWNKDLKMNGYGKYYLNNEKVLAEGNWDNGELKYARIFLPNGDRYEGQIKNSSFNGKGILESINGDIYEGDFLDMEKNGKGKITFKDGTIYEGNFYKGKFNGEGNMTWTNKYEYEGEFNGANLQGRGKLTFPEGDIYEGDFENSQFHGKGKYFFFESKNEYEGEFQYGIRKGKGIYTSTNQYIYDGNWDNDLPCGLGKLTNLKNNATLKSIWRYGKIAEEPIYEEGNENNFQNIDLNIQPDIIKLNAKGLPHLDIVEEDSTHYKLESSFTFLND